MNKATICSLFVFILFLASCRHELLPPNQPPTGGSGGSGSGGSGGAGTPCDPDKVYFQQQVLPILISNCTMSGCHDAASRQDGVILTSYEEVMRTAEVRPYNPGDSELYEVITESDSDDRMPRPPANPLTAAQKEIIYKWIQQGAQNGSCQSACDPAAAVTYSGTIVPLLSAKCAGCHGGGAPQGGINLTTYAGVKAKADDGRLWGAVNHQAGFSPMPKNGTKLSDCELAQLKKWMDAGALNN